MSATPVMATAIEITRLDTPEDRAFVEAQMIERFHGLEHWSAGREYDGRALPGFIAWMSGARAGHATFHLEDDWCEVVTLASATENAGVGSALLTACVREAKAAGRRRIFLTASNDNLRALGFYQRRGWRLVAVFPGRFDEYRAKAPELPEIGSNGIPLRDELELELTPEDKAWRSA